ncbi:NAD(P)H-binding protein [Actinoplanes sp. NPDC051470]|uniref:NAD(P)-dependent oxidoreductase n=1 Tax=Actinoplanes sp. NPDC051470 TaxID=3157224 RepID=UPI00341F92F4
MRITVIGATGGTGLHVVRQALDTGHEVTAVVRNPARLPAGPHVVIADVTRPDELRPAVKDSDVVITALGPRRGSPEPIVTPALSALLDTSPPRVILVSNSGMHGAGDPWPLRYLIKPILQRVLRRTYADAMRAEQTLQDSGTPWTIVRPPRLTDGPLTGTYRSATSGNPRWAASISRADLAHCLLRAATDPATAGQTISIGY